MNNKFILKLLAVLIFLMSLALAGNSFQTITFQGRLINSLGSPIDGTKFMKFKLYDAPTDGNLIVDWAGPYTVVCSDGNYAVELELTEAQCQAMTRKLSNYLEIYVNGTGSFSDPDKMSPRIHMSASAFAISAQQLEGLQINRSGAKDTSTGVYADGLEVLY